MSQTSLTPGQRFREAVATEHPLQVVGTINANHALLAKRAGFKAIYLSGGGVAPGCRGRAGRGLSGRAPRLTPLGRVTPRGARGGGGGGGGRVG
ncbi:hypothetical protein OFL32_02385, partial [Pseudomonas aeruginosa]|nr:hypothetical protein [Pseudomonas aeruginosa]